MKKLLLILLIFSSSHAFADYTLVMYSPSVNYINTLTVHHTEQQCEKTKENFESKFADKMKDQSGKERMKFECIDIANGGI